MTEEGFDKDTFCQRVLDQCQKRFISDNDPVTLLDVMLETETIDHDDYRDIMELTRTSDKNRELLKTIHRMGKKGYQDLKKCLKKSSQQPIVDHMERKEKDVKAIMKNENAQRQGKSGQISDEDLIFIAESIGKNWELLGPLLDLSDINMFHLKSNNSTVLLQIYHMLKSWKEKSDDSSFHKLMSILTTLPAVDIDFARINKRFNTAIGYAAAAEMPGDKSLINVTEQIERTSIQPLVDGFNIKITKIDLGKEIDSSKSHFYDTKTQENVKSVNAHANVRVIPATTYGIFDELGKKFEEYNPQTDSSSRKCTYDGRLMVFKKDFFDLIKNSCNKNESMKGGFGTVYLTDEKIPKLDIKVAIKEINCKDEDSKQSKHFENSTNNEKQASRLMHFAIVPLLGMGSENGMFWLLFPRLANGDLNTVIKKDTSRIDENSPEDIELNYKRRLKILYHINAAIDFLHTAIENFRGKLIHLDIKTSNVVLDEFYNARLTDFGVARETSGNKSSISTSYTAIPITDGYFKPPTFDNLDTYYDYYNVGVVIRELLTGKPPLFKSESKELCLKDLDNSAVEYYTKDEVWGEESGEFHDLVQRLLTLSKRCIDSASSGEVQKETKLTSKTILTECQKLVTGCCDGVAWECSHPNSQTKDDNSCEMCMVNPPVASDILSHSECNKHLKVCVSCMRNSYLNPLRCHSCFKEINPVIGNKWGAVLVAGQYEDKVLSESCLEDIKDIEKVIISKWPLVMGIREKFVKRIPQQSLQNDEDTKSQIQEAITALKEEDLSTILIYYTGQYSKESGFLLESKRDALQILDKGTENKYMQLREFTEMLRLFSKRRLIIILDCPEAPLLCSDEFGLSEHVDLVLLNCCKSNQSYSLDFAKRRFFKKAFIQGLTMTSTQQACFLQNNHDRKCEICPIEGKDFITIGNLEGYIHRHMQALDCGESIKTVQHASRGGWIGYLVHTKDTLNFKFTYNGMEKDCTIHGTFFKDINQLKEVLFEEFMDQMKIDKEKGEPMQLKANRFCDILRLVIKTGPKSTHKQELFTLEKVLSAWNGKRDLFVELRDITNVDEGMVGVFRTETTDKYFSYINDDWKHKQIMEEDKLIYKVDINTFLKQKKSNPEELHKTLMTLKKKSNAELHITALRSRNELLGVNFQREDFLCFQVVYLTSSC